MADNKFNEATISLAQSLRDTNQAIAESAVAAQERNMRFAQGTFENGIEVLKSNAEDTRNLIQTVTEQPQRPQEALQIVLNNAVAAQERNLRFAQSILQGSSDLLKSHVEDSRNLWQTVAQQSQRQQEAFQTIFRASMDAYTDFLRAPFSYYQQAWDTAESITRQGVETAQRITRQGVEAAQNATRQGVEATQRAARQGQQAAQSATE